MIKISELYAKFKSVVHNVLNERLHNYTLWNNCR